MLIYCEFEGEFNCHADDDDDKDDDDDEDDDDDDDDDDDHEEKSDRHQHCYKKQDITMLTFP